MRNPLEVDSRGGRVRSVVHSDEGGSAGHGIADDGGLEGPKGYG